MRLTQAQIITEEALHGSRVTPEPPTSSPDSTPREEMTRVSEQDRGPRARRGPRPLVASRDPTPHAQRDREMLAVQPSDPVPAASSRNQDVLAELTTGVHASFPRRHQRPETARRDPQLHLQD